MSSLNLSELNCSNGATSPYPALFTTTSRTPERVHRHLHCCIGRPHLPHRGERYEPDHHTSPPDLQGAEHRGLLRRGDRPMRVNLQRCCGLIRLQPVPARFST